MTKGKLIHPKAEDVWDDFKLLCSIKGIRMNDQINNLIDEFIENNSKLLKGVKNDREKN